MPCSSDTGSILRVIPAVECKGSASRKSFNSRYFRIGGGPLLQRLLNPRRGTISASGGFRAIEPSGRSGRLEAVPLDSQLFDLRFERLPGYTQLGRSTGGTPDNALRLSECVLDHFSFMFDKVSDQGTTRRNRVWRHHGCKPGVIDRKRLPVAQNHRTLDYILQLAHVARPVIGLEQVQGALVDMSNAFASSFGVAIDQILDQDGNIVDAFPQCWHSKREHVEAIEEILAEGTFSDGFT